MATPRRKNRKSQAEVALAATLDRLNLFDEISTEVLPILRQAIKERWSREKLFSHPVVEIMLSARQLNIALKSQDDSKAHTAIVNITDRVAGKPTEKKQIEHRYEKLQGSELDALLQSKLRTSDQDEDADEQDLPN